MFSGVGSQLDAAFQVQGGVGIVIDYGKLNSQQVTRLDHMSEDVLINREAARGFLSAIPDEAVRSLVDFGLVEALLACARNPDDGEVEVGQLPAGQFDMLFFARVLASMFAQKQFVRAVLQGVSADEASGWGF